MDLHQYCFLGLFLFRVKFKYATNAEVPTCSALKKTTQCSLVALTLCSSWMLIGWKAGLNRKGSNSRVHHKHHQTWKKNPKSKQHTQKAHRSVTTQQSHYRVVWLLSIKTQIYSTYLPDVPHLWGISPCCKSSKICITFKNYQCKMMWGALQTCRFMKHVLSSPCVLLYFQTLCALFRGVHQKNKSASGFDIINMLMGFDKAEQRMKVC